MNPKTDSKQAVRTASTLPVISGLRLTKQRQEVYQVLLEQRDHPTANEVYQRVRKKLPSISLATVYNCLEALVNHGLVNQVNFARPISLSTDTSRTPGPDAFTTSPSRKAWT